jgi:hypothetical protein
MWLLHGVSSHAHHAGDSASEKGDQLASVNAQTDARKYTVVFLGFLGKGGYECQQKMESQPCQRGNSRYVVQLGNIAVSLRKTGSSGGFPGSHTRDHCRKLSDACG